MRLPYPERKQTKANQIQRDREPSIKGVYLIENNLYLGAGPAPGAHLSRGVATLVNWLVPNTRTRSVYAYPRADSAQVRIPH